MFCVYVNVAVAEAALGGTADAVKGIVTPMTTTTHAIKSRSLCTKAPFTAHTSILRGQPMARRTAKSGRGCFGELPPSACLTPEVFSSLP